MTNDVVDRTLVIAALDFAWPTIAAAASDDAVCGTRCLHVVVIDGAGRVIGERSVGRERWDADYAAYARSKAERARAGESVAGGVRLAWGAVGVSGAHPWYDAAFAAMVAVAFRARHDERAALHDAAAG